jgi:hypothetical protein
MLLIIVLILIAFLLAGPGIGYRAGPPYGYYGYGVGGLAALVLLVLLILLLLGGLPPAYRY